MEYHSKDLNQTRIINPQYEISIYRYYSVIMKNNLDWVSFGKMPSLQ